MHPALPAVGSCKAQSSAIVGPFLGPCQVVFFISSVDTYRVTAVSHFVSFHLISCAAGAVGGPIAPQDKEVQGVQKLVPYKIIDGQDGAAWVEVQGNKMSPSQVSELVLCDGSWLCAHGNDFVGVGVGVDVVLVLMLFWWCWCWYWCRYCFVGFFCCTLLFLGWRVVCLADCAGCVGRGEGERKRVCTISSACLA